MYGRHVRGPLQILQKLWPGDVNQEEVRITYDYVINLREKLESTMEIAMDNLKQTSGRYKTQYDKHTRPKKLIVGEQVLLLQPIKQNILQTQWEGPYPIVEKV